MTGSICPVTAFAITIQNRIVTAIVIRTLFMDNVLEVAVLGAISRKQW